MAETELTEAEIEELCASQQRMREEINRKFEEVQSRFEETQSRIFHNIETQFDSFKLMMQAFLDKIDSRFKSPMADANASAEVIEVDKLLQPKEIDDYKSITSTNYDQKEAENNSKGGPSIMKILSAQIDSENETCKLFDELTQSTFTATTIYKLVDEDLDVDSLLHSQEEAIIEQDVGSSENEALKMFNRSTEPIFTGLKSFSGTFDSISTIEEVEFSSLKARIQLMEEVEESFPSKQKDVKLANQLFDEMPKSFSMKTECPSNGRTLFDEMSDLSLVKHNDKIKGREEVVLQVVEPSMVLGYEEDASETSKFIFDPGGITLHHVGYNAFECNKYSVFPIVCMTEVEGFVNEALCDEISKLNLTQIATPASCSCQHDNAIVFEWEAITSTSQFDWIIGRNNWWACSAAYFSRPLDKGCKFDKGRNIGAAILYGWGRLQCSGFGWNSLPSSLWKIRDESWIILGSSISVSSTMCIWHSIGRSFYYVNEHLVTDRSQYWLFFKLDLVVPFDQQNYFLDWAAIKSLGLTYTYEITTSFVAKPMEFVLDNGKRKLRFLKDKIHKSSILPSQPASQPDIELEELEVHLAEHEHELIEMNSNGEKLRQTYNESLEFKLVLQKASDFLVSSGRNGIKELPLSYLMLKNYVYDRLENFIWDPGLCDIFSFLFHLHPWGQGCFLEGGKEDDMQEDEDDMHRGRY